MRAAATVTFVLLVTILLLGMPLRTGAAPLGIVSLQFATSPMSADAMLASWVSVPRARVLWAHGLDLFLPVAYAVAIGAAVRHAAPSPSISIRAAGIAPAAAVVAAVADQIENLAMGVTLLRGPSWGSVLVTLSAATVKSAMLIVALAALSSVLVAVRRIHRAVE